MRYSIHSIRRRIINNMRANLCIWSGPRKSQSNWMKNTIFPVTPGPPLPSHSTVRNRIYINGYRLENSPPLRKFPPCYVPIWNKGGAFLSLIRAEGPRKFWGILHWKHRFSRQKPFRKRAKSSKFSPAARSGQEGPRKRSNNVYYLILPIYRAVGAKKMGYVIKLKKAPYYKKAPPPLLCSDLEQGGLSYVEYPW